MSTPTESLQEQAERELYGDEYELRKLLNPAKRRAVALFKDDHDNGDTAIYQFISDIVPLIQAEIARRTEKLEREYTQRYDLGYAEGYEKAVNIMLAANREAQNALLDEISHFINTPELYGDYFRLEAIEKFIAKKRKGQA